MARWTLVFVFSTVSPRPCVPLQVWVLLASYHLQLQQYQTSALQGQHSTAQHNTPLSTHTGDTPLLYPRVLHSLLCEWVFTHGGRLLQRRGG